MHTQKMTQAIVEPGIKLNPHKAAQRLQMFDPAGDPFVPGRVRKAEILSSTGQLWKAGTPEVGQVLAGTWNLWDHATHPFTLIDPDGILEIDLATEGEVKLRAAGFWSIQTNSAGSVQGGADAPVIAYNNHYNYTTNTAGVATQEVTGSIGMTDGFHLSQYEVDETHIYEPSLLYQGTVGYYSVSIWRTLFTVLG